MKPCTTVCGGALLRYAVLASSPTKTVCLGRCAPYALHYASDTVGVSRRCGRKRNTAAPANACFTVTCRSRTHLADFCKAS